MSVENQTLLLHENAQMYEYRGRTQKTLPGFEENLENTAKVQV